MADDRTLLATRIILQAILPVMKVVISDDPAMKKRFESVTARVQFTAKNGSENLGAALVFNRGNLTIDQGVGGRPTSPFPLARRKNSTPFSPENR